MFHTMHHLETCYMECGNVSKRRRIFNKEGEAADVKHFKKGDAPSQAGTFAPCIGLSLETTSK